MKGVFGYEWRRLIGQKKIPITFALIFIATVAALCLAYWLKPAVLNAQPDKRQLMEKYASEAAYYQELLDSASDNANLDVADISKYIERCKFFLQTDTTEFDYMDSYSFATKIKGSEAVGFMLFTEVYGFFPLMAFAVIFAVWFFSVDFYKDTIKNVFAAPLSRNRIFASKYLCGYALMLAAFSALFLLGLISGLCGKSVSVLLYSNHFYAIDAVSVFLFQSLNELLILSCFYALAAYLGTLIKNPLISGVIPYAAYWFIALIGAAVTSTMQVAKLFLQSSNALNYFPFIGLQNYVGFFDSHWAVMFAVHLAIFAAFSGLAHIKFRKADC